MLIAMWIDTHAHLDAPEFDADRDPLMRRCVELGVSQIVIPAVAVDNFATVQALAHRHQLAYALGIHPMCVATSPPDALEQLADALERARDDPRLVAVGEIGIDLFLPELKTPESRAAQEHLYHEQLKLARRAGLPVLLHARRSADVLLKHLRQVDGVCGIAHAFNGSQQQADAFVERGFALGFGGAVTFDTASQIRRIALQVPLSAIVTETDSPDIAPQWLYRTASERGDGGRQARNTPAELPRIGAALAALREIDVDEFARITRDNACRVLRRLGLVDPLIR
jgi:TatD DNase family protein